MKKNLLFSSVGINLFSLLALLKGRSKVIWFLSCLLLGLFLVPTNVLFSQNNQIDKTQKGFWLEMMQDPNVDFKELQKDFTHYWENKSDYKGNGYKIFKRWEYINEYRVLEDGRLQSPAYVMEEYQKYISAHGANKSASGDWSLVGPSAYPTNSTGQPTGIGRVNAIAFHPSDVNTIYVGAPAGGFWKSTDGGSSWSNLSSNLPTLGVSSILVHPSSPSTIYIGSGDRDGGDAFGLGVFKTTNGGSSWTQINNTMGNVTVGEMVMHPSDPLTILAATSSGIYKTTNGGSSWNQETSGNTKDIKFNPGNPDIVYATYASSYYGAKFLRSDDNGDSWVEITSGIPNGGTAAAGARMVIGVSADEPSYVYLVQIEENTKVLQSLLRSTDNGLSFSVRSTSPNILDYACDGSGTSSQATYDLCITADPTDGNTIYVGGINNWKSTDGGANWNIVSHWVGSSFGESCAASVHADQHYYAWNNGKLYVGHDGGIHYSANGGTSWTEITNGLAINQIYKLGQSATNADLVIFGQQDNGTAVGEASAINTVIGGDGTESIIDYSDNTYRYGCYVTGEIKRSKGGGYYDIAKVVNGLTESGPWVTPYLLHKTDPSTMFAGYQNVWRTNNVKASSYSSVSWSAISTGETGNCIAIEQSPANVDIVYVSRSGSLKRSINANATAASVSWTACALPGGNTPTDLEAHPTDESILYATAGYGVYKSTDKGDSWTNISGTLPSLFTNSLVYDKNSNEGIYVSNQTGVFYKDADMADWELFSTGLPIVDVRELEIYYDSEGTQNRLKAATYGRGLWESDLYESGVLNPTSFEATPTGNTQIGLSWALSGGNDVILAFNTSATFGTPVDGNDYAVSASIPGGGTVIYNGGGTSYSHTSLNPVTTYYYKIWSKDGSLDYSSGTTANATTTESVADFSYDASMSCNGSLTVNFTDASIGAYGSWAWDVNNDGTTDYTTQNPSHTYSSAGLYSVKLTINNGADDIIKNDIILVLDAEPAENNGCTLDEHNTGNGGLLGIYNFEFAEIANTTSYNDAHYNNYACTDKAILNLNTTYDITIQTGTFNSEGARVYIDFDGDGIFESGESVATFASNTSGERTTSFTTPSSGVVMDSALRLRVISRYSGIPSSACDNYYGQVEDYTVYFKSEVPTWTGAISSTWDNTGNWSNGVVPGASDDVVIANAGTAPVIASGVGADCKNLTINSGATLTVASGGSIIPTGTITNNGTVNMQRSISDNQWHLISIPVSGMTSSMFENDNLQNWNETTGLWVPITDLGVDLFIKKGYGLWPTPGKSAYTFSGTPLTGDQSIDLVDNGSGGSYDGANLLGNPYPSSIDWNQASGSYGAVYYWNGTEYLAYPATGGFGTGSRYVAPMQGFFVIADSPGTFTFTDAMRTHSGASSYYKSEQGLPDGIMLAATSNTYEDLLLIRENNEATPQFDYDRDALKLASGISGKSEIWTIADDQNLSIDVRPELTRIQLGYSNNQNGTYQISIKDLAQISSVELEDTKLNQIQDLSIGAYSFNWQTTDSEERFILHLKATGTEELEAQDAQVYAANGQVYIRMNNPGDYNQVQVFDLSGRLIVSSSLKNTEIQSVKMASSGVYMVKLSGDSVSQTEKIIIE